MGLEEVNMKENAQLPFKIVMSVRGASLVAHREIKYGEIVISLRDLKPQSLRTYQTIQVRDNHHVVEDSLAKLNHSCDPTITIDTVAGVCVAARDIEEGEELNFFYPSTETEMAEPFKCKCESVNCIEYVNGALALPVHVLIGRSLSPHVVTALKAKFSRQTA